VQVQTWDRVEEGHGGDDERLDDLGEGQAAPAVAEGFDAGYPDDADDDFEDGEDGEGEDDGGGEAAEGGGAAGPFWVAVDGGVAEVEERGAGHCGVCEGGSNWEDKLVGGFAALLWIVLDLGAVRTVS